MDYTAAISHAERLFRELEENGDANFTVATLMRLSLALGMTLENPMVV